MFASVSAGLGCEAVEIHRFYNAAKISRRNNFYNCKRRLNGRYNI